MFSVQFTVNALNAPDLQAALDELTEQVNLHLERLSSPVTQEHHALNVQLGTATGHAQVNVITEPSMLLLRPERPEQHTQYLHDLLSASDEQFLNLLENRPTVMGQEQPVLIQSMNLPSDHPEWTLHAQLLTPLSAGSLIAAQRLQRGEPLTELPAPCPGELIYIYTRQTHDETTPGERLYATQAIPCGLRVTFQLTPLPLRTQDLRFPAAELRA